MTLEVTESYAECLPCVEANLEVLLRLAGVEDVLTVLGGLCVMVARPPNALRLQPVTMDDWIRRRTNLRLMATPYADNGRLLGGARRLIHEGAPALIFADAFSVPWSPYLGQEHHEHAFVIDAWDDHDNRSHVIDAYTNITRYGKAERCELWIDASDLVALLRPHGRCFKVAHFVGSPSACERRPEDMLETVKLNVAAHGLSRQRRLDAQGLADHFAAPRQLNDLRWLALATWLAARSRRMHVTWWKQTTCLTALAPCAPEISLGEEVAAAWDRAQTASYLAWRRVEAGRDCPPLLSESVARAAEAEHCWFESMRDWLEEAERR